MGEFRTSRRIRTAAAAVTDVGRQRKHNEDHVLVKADLGLYVVADGMGGHNAGNVASALTTKSIDNYFEATQVGELPGPLAPDEIELHPEARRIVAGVRKANHDVFLISNTHTQHQGMGSTVVAAYVSDETDQIHIGHVGDSRCYRIRDGALEQLTRDHSLINDALEIKPDLSPDDLARLPKNIITRALGMKDAVKVDIRSERLQEGDIFLLCSDGLSGMVSEEQILDAVVMTKDPREACELLIAMANDAGGNDNISALIIRIEEEVEEKVVEEEAPQKPPPVSLPRRAVTTTPHRIDELGSVLPPEGTESVAALGEIDLGLSLPEVEGATGDEGAPPVATPRDDKPDAPEPLPLVTPRRRPISGRYAEVAGTSRSAAATDSGPVRSSEDSAPAKARRPVGVRVARCKVCNHELFIGNRFCVECGAPIQL